MIPVVAQYPILAPNKLDYLEGNQYEVESSEQNGETAQKTIHHKLSGQNLIRDLVLDGVASFACTVVAPEYAYRKLELVSAEDLQQSEDLLSAKQSLKTETSEYAPPVVFQSFVIMTKKINSILLKESHGISQLWIDQEINLPRSAKIALGPYFANQATLQSILRIKQAQKDLLPRGCFEVEAVDEAGFYFSVSVEESLYRSLKDPQGAHAHRDSIYCFALAQGLEILSREYSEEESWRKHLHLRALHSLLEKNNAPTWEDENFSANRAVAMLKPHEIHPLDLSDSVPD